MSFESRYKGLNPSQQKAVDTIDGPVMVVAGPGTGKTELLSMRTANILRLTDTSPSSILCITYTDSGAAAIRDRLIDIIGQDAYKVPIHTFHSFGLEVINQNPEFFYNGAQYRNIDDLTSYQILDTIFRELPHSDLLSSRNKKDFTYSRDIKTFISEVKKSGLTGAELLNILDSNELTIQKSNVILNNIFTSADRINMKMVNMLKEALPEIASTSTPTGIEEFKPLADVMVFYLQEAVEKSLELNKTSPVTEWRNEWMNKDVDKNFELKSIKRQAKLRSACNIYNKYLDILDEEQLFDYDDMILRVVHACITYPELRYNLQEKFQYIMIDEFQDTNIAQMRLIGCLTDTIIDSEKPNIMIVGDDDQAIYSFQGADISNIINFSHNYPGAEIISLTENYRSTPEILSLARSVIIEGKDRLENHYTNLSKELKTNKSSGLSVNIYQTQSSSDEKIWLIDSVKNKLENGKSAKDIAILTRNHADILNLIPYFTHENIPFSYQRKNDVLKQPPIKWLLNCLQIVSFLKNNRLRDANSLMSEFLSHDSWGIKPQSLFEISLYAYKEKKTWIEAISEKDDLKHIFQFLIEAVKNSVNFKFENFLDFIMGKENSISPFLNYFFSNNKRNENPEEYINFLNGLSALRKKFREFMPNVDPTIDTFLEFIRLHQRSELGIYLIDDYAGFDDGVRIMTAHSSKGLEYDTVYIFNAVENVWGRKAKSTIRLLGYPENMPLKQAGDRVDEQIRLFYVSVTRAKNELLISYSDLNSKEKHNDLVEFLVDESKQPIPVSINKDKNKITEIAEINWYEPLIESKIDLRTALKNTLDKYKLSATHFNNFLDVSRGGPEHFLMHNLLRFPEAKSPSSSYGSAIHDSLKIAHEHFRSQKQIQPTEDILANFEKSLTNQRLKDIDFDYYLKKGQDNLSKFLNLNPELFKYNQIPELDFSNQQCSIDEARLTGKIDVYEKNDDNSVVIDYKTGKASGSWVGHTDSEKIKLHKYRQQLMFYKIMTDSSRDYSKNTVSTGQLIFIEPDRNGEVHKISINFNFEKEELERTKNLIKAVWEHITTLNIPDTTSYRKDISGIKKFEKDLLENVI